MKRDLYKTSHNENLTKYYLLYFYVTQTYLLKKIEDDNLEFM
jgi:hypothetical protein